jgi:hypothetical protein
VITSARDEGKTFMEAETMRPYSDPPKEALDRKAQSETILAAEGVPFMQWLAPIAMNDLSLRSQEEVAYRSLAIMIVAVKGEGLEHGILESVIKNYGLEPHFSPKEKTFIEDPNPSQFDRVQFSWRYEAGWVLLWALGFIDKLGRPDRICDPALASKIVSQRTTATFLADARLRPSKEIADGADLILRYHWAVRNAQINRQAPAAGLNPGVVQERHYAFNWLIGDGNLGWDDVNTGT